jgi:alkylation response protein AidB-like acyl-CoA dehydrogenase
VDFDWTEEEQSFRLELQAFIRDNIRSGWTHHQREMPEPEDREEVLKFCRALGTRGLLTSHWPCEYGGRDASAWEQTILSEEMWAAGEPRGPQYMNTSWIGPAIILAGTPEQKAFHLPRIASGDAMWCQGFSEPDSGSDLASLQTRARRDGDSYVINGQKIWTSYAHTADHCFLLVRTDPQRNNGDGITILLVPMDLPGVEVRDIPNPWVAHLFHEIYFTDVVVPDSCRLGRENEGWRLVRQALANERIGIARHECAERTLDASIRAAEARGVDTTDASLADVVGTAYAACEAARVMLYAAVDERARAEDGARPGASSSRVLTATMERTVAHACAEVLGEWGHERSSAAQRQLTAGTTAPLAAGSLEVQLNLIARFGLGLPKS